MARSTRVALLILVTSAVLPVLTLGQSSEPDILSGVSIPQVSFVLEPFELLDSARWFFGEDTIDKLSVSHDALFGKASLQLNVTASATIDSSVDFGWLQGEKVFNCHGADYLSFWYKIDALEQAVGDTPVLQLILYEDQETLGSREDQTSYADLQLYQEHTILPTVSLHASAEDEDWQEVRIPFNETVISLHRLRGWRFQVNGSRNATLLLDHLACYGGGEMLGNAFYADNQMTWKNLVDQDIWTLEFYESGLSTNQSEITISNDGVLTNNFTIEQVEAWGGFISLMFATPGTSYYNLSQATDIAIGYHVTQPATVPDRAHFRFILLDSSDCVALCPDLANERWFSFHYVLDEIGSGQIKIPLIGSEDSSAPFWLTGWSGGAGNRQLDPEYIKGFTLEFTIGSGEMYSSVQGIVELYDIQAISVLKATDSQDFCRVETEVGLNRSKMEQHEFLGNQCCETCQADPECLYAVVDGFNCYTTAMLDLDDNRGIPNTESARNAIVTIWMDDATRRGDFCNRCDCQEAMRTIDCRGAGLRTIPKSFTPVSGQDGVWRPRVLDLRNNPNLILLGGGSLDEISDSLEELWLPAEMKHISKSTLKELKSLKSIHYEGGTAAQNVISKLTDAFGDVCCSPGEQLDLMGPTATTLTFCNMSLYEPGIDATYIPFRRYYEATYLKELGPTSPFLSEASETVEKCAEACTISAGCNYYFFDARKTETEHTCHLLVNKGIKLGVECCHPNHYADEEMTEPGLIAGLPPRTRHIDETARIMVVDGQNLVLEEANGYQAEFTLSLGSKPTRGAVWVTPSMISSLTNMEVSITPQRAVFYDENATVPITVRITFPSAGGSAQTSSANFVIHNDVESCDAAFTSGLSTGEDTIFVDVSVPDQELALSDTTIILMCAAVLVVVVLGMGIYAYLARKQKQNDMVWKVLESELHFGDPPEILGRGTFGLVLAAEYRGTRIAVKRVIPKLLKRSERTKKPRNSLNSDPYFDEEGLTSTSGVWGVDVVATSAADNSASKTSTTITGSESLQLANAKAMAELKSRTNPGIGLRGQIGHGGMRNKLKKDFIREMRHLSKLRHPCITTVMGAVIEPNVEPMLVMELMDLGSLYDLLHNDSMLVEGEIILPILRDVAQGMNFLHSAKPMVVHGDLKAANILVDCRFRAKIADFGSSLAKQYVGATGTFFWMAPELLRGVATNTPSTDAFSFGIVLYEVYSRRDPYEGEAFKDVIRLVMDRLVNKRPPVPKNMPKAVQSMMMDCLREDPSVRPTFRKLDQLLNEISAESVEPTKKEETLERRDARDALPEHITKLIKNGGKPDAERHDMITIFYSEVVGLAEIAEDLEHGKVIDLLDRLYSSFDDCADKYGLYKVATAGDSYMAATNLTKRQPNDHVRRVALFAAEATLAAQKIQVDLEDPTKGFAGIKAAFSSGPCVADVVGTKRPVYTVFGDTVNTVARLASHSVANRLLCSKASADLLREQYPEMPLVSRGTIMIKGSEVDTYWANESLPSSTVAEQAMKVAAGDN